MESSVDAKAEFRKPLADAANRKYRRRSPPANRSSSPDESPSRDRSSSPALRRESAKLSDDRRRKDDGRDLHRDSGRSHYGRGDSYKYADRQSSRSSHSHRRHDDYDRRHKYTDDTERDNSKSSSWFGRDSRGSAYSDIPKRDNELRSRDSPRELEYPKCKEKDSSSDRGVSDRRKEDRDARDFKTDRRKGLGDHRNNRSPAHEESREYQNDSTSRGDSAGRRLSVSSRGDTKESRSEKYTKEENKKYDDRDRYKERSCGESREKLEDRKSPHSKGRDSPAKRPKVFSMDTNSSHGHNADEKQSLNSKQALEPVGKITSEQVYVTDAGIDAAKTAAMKAAELVNRNLVGTGYMSTEQKKRLLWGNKKNTAAEESAHRWETPLFDDRERQEKFNKLMGVKGEIKVEQKPEVDDAEKQKIQMDLEKQYTAGLRRRDGRTVGLGL